MRRLGPTIGLSCRSSSISSRSSSSNCCCCNIPEGLNIQQQPCQNLNLAISLFVSLFCCLSALFLCLFHSFFSSLIIFLTSCLLHSSRLSPYLCFIYLSLSVHSFFCRYQYKPVCSPMLFLCTSRYTPFVFCLSQPITSLADCLRVTHLSHDTI